MARLLKNLHRILRILAIIGVIIAYGDLRGWFVDSDRLHVYKSLTSGQKLSVDDKGVKKFLDDNFYILELPHEMAKETVDGLTSKGLAIGTSRLMSGTVHVRFESGRLTGPIYTFDELRAWAYETPFYAWIGWLLLCTGVMVETFIDVIEAVCKRRNPKPSKNSESAE